MERKQANPAMITLARESRGYNQKEMAKRANMAQSTISKLERGTIELHKEIVRVFSRVLRYPMSFFYQQGEIYPANMNYRKKATIKASRMSQIEAEMNIFRLNVQHLLDAVELPEMNVPHLDVEFDETPESAAKALRTFWRLPKGPVKNICRLLEKKGILVIETDFEKVDGRSIYTKNKQPIIFIDKSIPTDRKRFTLAHELGHLVMHMGFIIPEERDVEDEAHRFASEFLVPSNEFLPQVRGKKYNIPLLSDLKRYWLVSMASLVYKGKRLGVINKNQSKYLWIQFGKLKLRKREWVNLDPPPEKPTMLQQIVEAHLNELDYTEEEMASFLCLNIDDFKDRYLNFNNIRKLKII